ncbi:amidohydrolase family protein [Hyphomicrobiales bacterium]|jgi:5-methylthioadenosine/S-adenosylhomocysteine deaminase|nr:amidohydrolase family protein [Hyphomicrobiales bacterium]
MNNYILKNAQIISMDDNIGDFNNADILVNNDKITSVSKDIHTDSNVDVIDCSNMIIAPGFINTHIHTWQTGLRGVSADWTLSDYLKAVHSGLASYFKPEDIEIANYVGALHQIHCGTTTLVDWCHNNPTANHTNSAINGLRRSNIRAIFLHGSPKHPPKEGQKHFSEIPMPKSEIVRLRKDEFNSNDDLLSLGLAVLGPQQSIMAVCEEDFRLANDLDLFISMHIGGQFLTPNGFDDLNKLNLLSSKTNIVHANRITDDMLNMLIEANVTFSLTPEVELQMGFGNPLTKRLIEHNGRMAFGSDIESAMAADMFSVIRTSLQAVRHEITLESYEKTNKPPDKMSVSSRNALEWATINAASILSMDNIIGSISPGKKADLIMFKKDEINFTPTHDPIASILFHSGPRDIDSVIINGSFVKRNGNLIDKKLPSLLEKLNESGKRIVHDFLAR